MPEIVTKYPDLILREFKDAGIQCGVATPKILVTCPKEKFCKLPTGEICIYSINEVPAMTQIHALDLFLFPSMAISLFSLMVMIFLIGMYIGTKIRKR